MYSTRFTPLISGFLSVLAVVTVFLVISLVSVDANAAAAVVSDGKSAVDTAGLVVLVSSVINAVIPVKYRGFLAPVIEILSLAFWSGKNAEPNHTV
jgi:hypothetical protein